MFHLIRISDGRVNWLKVPFEPGLWLRYDVLVFGCPNVYPAPTNDDFDDRGRSSKTTHIHTIGGNVPQQDGSSMAATVLEALGTSRSMRWFNDDPIEPELIDRLIWAATRASSPSNTQPWEFVVVTDSEIRRTIQGAIAANWSAFTAPTAASPTGNATTPTDPVQQRTLLGVQHLVDSLGQVPVLVFVCANNAFPKGAPRAELAYSAMYAAAQNLLVAARSLDLGTAFTTLHRQAEEEIRQLLQIPAEVLMGVTMPIGWPARSYGPVSRRPIEEVIHRNTW